MLTDKPVTVGAAMAAARKMDPEDWPLRQMDAGAVDADAPVVPAMTEDFDALHPAA